MTFMKWARVKDFKITFVSTFNMGGAQYSHLPPGEETLKISNTSNTTFLSTDEEYFSSSSVSKQLVFI